jgi:hypothetical protein
LNNLLIRDILFLSLMFVYENPHASVYSLTLHGLYSTRNMANKGLMQYPLLATRKFVVTLLDARRIDFHVSLVSLQGQLL